MSQMVYMSQMTLVEIRVVRQVGREPPHVLSPPARHIGGSRLPGTSTVV